MHGGMWQQRLTLRPGARGPAVRALRWRLSSLGWTANSGNGFDMELAAAVRDFQESCGLEPDGIVGPATWQALYAQPGWTPAAGAPEILARRAGPALLDFCRVPVRSPWAPDLDERPAVRIEVRLEDRTLLLHTPDGATPFPVAVGRPDAPTPVGRFVVAELIAYPGPPLGTRWIRLKPDECSIHGTDEPWLVGTAATPGCLRLYNKDVEYVYHRVAPGTPVDILP